MRWWLSLLLLSLLGCSQNHKVLKDAELGGLFFLDSSRGWLVGRENPSRSVFVASTSDGGKNWDTQRVEGNSDGILSGVAFRDPQCGWAAGSHALAFSTQDGGATWVKEQALGDSRALRYREGNGCLVLGAPGYAHKDGFWAFSGADMKVGSLQTRADGGRLFHPFDVQFVDAQTLWGSGAAELYRSVDGGRKWTVLELPETLDGSTIVRGVQASFFVSPTTGWIALQDGQLLTTTDGAATRAALAPVGLEGLVGRRLFFFDAQTGLMLAGDRQRARVLTTADGGKHWTRKLELGEGEWSELFVLDSGHAWVAGRAKGAVVVRRFIPG